MAVVSAYAVSPGCSPSHQIVLQLGTLLPGIDQAAVKELLGQVRSCWLTLRFLPAPIANLLRGQHFTSLEMAALEARLLHELRQSRMAVSLGLVHESTSAAAECTSGIPPPVMQVAASP